MLERFYNTKDISALEGKTITNVTGLFPHSKCITIACDDGTEYKIDHQQDDDEEVYVWRIIPTSMRFDAHVDSEAHAKMILKDSTVLSAQAITELDEAGVIEVPGTTYGKDWVEYSRSATLFSIFTDSGSLQIIWKGFAKSQELSTMVDFVQTKGGQKNYSIDESAYDSRGW